MLKGAVLFALWGRALRRPTRDVDFLGAGDPPPEAVAAVFRAICDTPAEPDGLTFLAESVAAEPIRDRQQYGGVRVRLLAMLGTARVRLQVDVAFGDAVTPAPEVATFPTLLADLPAPQVRAYPAETVVPEKFHAMVLLGVPNTPVTAPACTVAQSPAAPKCAPGFGLPQLPLLGSNQDSSDPEAHRG